MRSSWPTLAPQSARLSRRCPHTGKVRPLDVRWRTNTERLPQRDQSRRQALVTTLLLLRKNWEIATSSWQPESQWGCKNSRQTPTSSSTNCAEQTTSTSSSKLRIGDLKTRCRCCSCRSRICAFTTTDIRCKPRTTRIRWSKRRRRGQPVEGKRLSRLMRSRARPRHRVKAKELASR